MRALLALCTVVALLLGALPASAEPGTAPGGVRDAVSYPDSDGLTVAPLDGGEQRNLGVVGTDEDWSPDGRRLAYVTEEGVFVVDVASAQVRQIAETDEASGPEWSPDGRWVVFTEEDSGQLTVVHADGAGDYCPCEVGRRPPAGAWDLEPAWSPDGTTIAFTRLDGRTGAHDLGVIDMTDFPGTGNHFTSTMIVTQTVVDAFPGLSWSPDSAKLAFSGMTRTGGSPIDIYVVDRAGAALRLLVRDDPGWAAFDPVFSPLGDEIAYTRNFVHSTQNEQERLPQDGLYVVSVQSAERYHLVSTAYQEVNPAWTADDRLIFQSRTNDSGDHRDHSEFWVVRSDGVDLRQLDIPSLTQRLEVAPGYTVQIPGTSRVETAVNVSKASYDTAEQVVIATAGNYPDALAGAPLAAMLDAPLLLVPNPDFVHAAVIRELRRLRATHAVLLGDETLLNDGLVEELHNLGLSTERIAGPTRFDTAAGISERLEARQAFVVEGAHADPRRGWPDAVAVAGLAGHLEQPILLVERDRLPDATRAALVDGDFDSVRIIGDEASVSSGVAAELAGLGLAVMRTGGETRYDTSRLVAELSVAEGMSPKTPWLTIGSNWPDSLAAGPAAAASGGVLLLVDGQSGCGAYASFPFLDEHSPLDVGLLVGGADVITPAARMCIEQLSARFS